MPTIKITKPQGQNNINNSFRSNQSNFQEENSKSPRFFVKTNDLNIKKKSQVYGSFTELSKNYGKPDTLSVHLGQDQLNRPGSFNSLDNLNNPQLDFKQQELLRRQNIAEYSISGEIDPDDDDIFDEEYYEFLKRVEGLRKIIKREDFDFCIEEQIKSLMGKIFIR